MTEHWLCPSCKTIFEKSTFQAIEQFYKEGIPMVFGNSLSCPLCKHPIDPWALLNEKYDHQLFKKPSQEKLE